MHHQLLRVAWLSRPSTINALPSITDLTLIYLPCFSTDLTDVVHNHTYFWEMSVMLFKTQCLFGLPKLKYAFVAQKSTPPSKLAQVIFTD